MKTFDGTPKADAGLRHAQHNHDFALSKERLAEHQNKRHEGHISQLAETLRIERSQILDALRVCGLCLCPLEARPQT